MKFKKIIPVSICAIFLAASFSFTIPVKTEQEYLLKAAFVYRFAEYIDWGLNEGETFTIAVVGDSEIAAPLNEISKGKRVKNKRIIVKQYLKASELGSCQMVFISRNSGISHDEIVENTGYRPILIITEQEIDFAKGSHINFLISDNKLKFEVNLRAVNRSGLKISSQLLQHALEIRR